MGHHIPQPHLASQPGLPHGIACRESPNVIHEHLTTGAGVIQAKDPGNCISSRDLGAEPGGRRPGSAQPQPARTLQAGRVTSERTAGIRNQAGRRPHSGLASSWSHQDPGLGGLPSVVAGELWPRAAHCPGSTRPPTL